MAQERPKWTVRGKSVRERHICPESNYHLIYCFLDNAGEGLNRSQQVAHNEQRISQAFFIKYISHDEQCTTVGSIGCSFVPVQCPSSAPTSPPSTIGLVLANIPWWSIYAGGPLFPYVTAYRMYCSASVKGNKIKFKGVGREKLRRNCV